MLDPGMISCSQKVDGWYRKVLTQASTVLEFLPQTLGHFSVLQKACDCYEKFLAFARRPQVACDPSTLSLGPKLTLKNYYRPWDIFPSAESM